MILASVIPCTIIIVVGLCHLIGWTVFEDTALVGGVVILAILVVSWWWWAMITLKFLVKDRTNSLEVLQRWFAIRNRRLEILEKEVKKLKKIAKDIDK